MNQTNRKQALRLLCAALLGAAAYGATWLPYAASLAVPLLMVLSAGCASFGGAVVGSVVFAGLSLAIDGTAFLPSIALAVVAAIAAAAVFRWANRAFFALVGCCGAVLLAMWAEVLVAVLLNGTAAIEAIYAVDHEVLQLLKDYYALTGMSTQSAAAIAAEAAALYSDMVPAMFLASSMIAGVLGFGIGSFLAKNRIHYTLQPFSRWAMPKGHFLGALLLLAVSYGGRALGWPGFESVALAVNTFILVTYSIQGVCVLWFLFGRTRMRLPVRILLTGLLAVVASSGLVLVYLLDEMMMMRRRTPPGPPPTQNRSM